MTYTYKSIRLHRDTKIFLRDYSMLFPFYFDFHIASEVRTSAIDTRILPSEIVADINRDKSEEVWSKRTYLELFTSNPVQLWYTRVNQQTSPRRIVATGTSYPGPMTPDFAGPLLL